MTAVLEGVRTWSTSAPASSDGLYSAATASNEAIAGRTGVLERRWVTAGMAPPWRRRSTVSTATGCPARSRARLVRAAERES